MCRLQEHLSWRSWGRWGLSGYDEAAISLCYLRLLCPSFGWDKALYVISNTRIWCLSLGRYRQESLPTLSWLCWAWAKFSCLTIDTYRHFRCPRELEIPIQAWHMIQDQWRPLHFWFGSWRPARRTASPTKSPNSSWGLTKRAGQRTQIHC